MRLQSLYTPVRNQRIKTTCVANIFMLSLLTSQVWSYANIEHNRFVRQLNDETAVNHEDISTTTTITTAHPYHQPHFIGNRSVVVQLFEWKFVDIAAECREFLGPQGYAGVQISPVLEHTVVRTDELNHPWWERYEVVSYRLASRSGDESDFWSMSRICNEHGVRIYADVVLNHMAAPLYYMTTTGNKENEQFIVNTLLETNVNLTQLNYSNVSYTHNDFHKPSCLVLTNTQDAHVIRNCQLNGHPDLDHSRGNVQKHIVEMLNKFIDMGVAGFRIDSAKYMWPIDLKNIFNQVKNLSTEFNFKKNTRPFVYHDVFDFGLDAVSKTEYSTYGVVSEYLYPAELSTILRGKVPLSSLINWGPALGFLAHDDSLVFIDSHDTQRGVPNELGNNQLLTYKQRIKYIMANAFMLVHSYGAIKRIMSSYYFLDTEINHGPPVEEANEEEIRSPEFDEGKQCTRESGWVCEHRWPELVNLIKVANYFKAPGNKEQRIMYFQTNGPNQVAFCRGQKAFMAINNDVEMDFIKDVYACLEPGWYCDMVSGGKKEGEEEECHGKVLEINDQGYMKLELSVADDKRVNKVESDQIKSYGIVVIYLESKIKPVIKNKTEEKPTESDPNEEDADKQAAENEPTVESEKEEETAEENSEKIEKEDMKVNENETETENKEELSTEVVENPDKETEEPPVSEQKENEQQPDVDSDKAAAEVHTEDSEKVVEKIETGTNESRNLDEKNVQAAEEQIEKPTAEIVDKVTDVSNTVVTKNQDIQKAGMFSNPQDKAGNG